MALEFIIYFIYLTLICILAKLFSALISGFSFKELVAVTFIATTLFPMTLTINMLFSITFKLSDADGVILLVMLISFFVEIILLKTSTGRCNYEVNTACLGMNLFSIGFVSVFGDNCQYVPKYLRLRGLINNPEPLMTDIVAVVLVMSGISLFSFICLVLLDKL